MDRELIRRLLAAGAFMGLIFALAFLHGAEAPSPPPVAEGPSSS